MNESPLGKDYTEDLEDESLFLMTNLVQELTGLTSILLISPKMNNCGPRVKVQGDDSKKLNKDLLFTVTVSDEPEIIGDTGLLSEKEIATIKGFVQVNKDTLLEYWDEHDIDIISIISKLKKVEGLSSL